MKEEKETVDQLIEELVMYGQHINGCPLQFDSHNEKGCTCGLDEVIGKYYRPSLQN